jgi:hypothetical protein
MLVPTETVTVAADPIVQERNKAAPTKATPTVETVCGFMVRME